MRINRNFFSFIALLMIASMLVACQATVPSQSATPSASAAPTATPAETVKPSDAPSAEASAPVAANGFMAPYKDTVTVTIINEDVGGTKFADGEDFNNNLWTKAWKKDLNIEVKTLWISNEYITKLNLAIAAQDLPDMYNCDNIQFQQLLDAGQLADITDAYQKNVSPQLRKMLEEDDPDIFATTQKDGKIYGIPRLHYGYECMTYFMWIKNSWYEKAGKPEIKTLDQFEALMKTFMTDNKQTFAMPLSKGLEQFYYMAPTFHAYPKIWMDDGTGKIAYGSTMPVMKTMLAKWADWYKQGLLRPDWATLDAQTKEADVINGKVGVEPGENWYGWVHGDSYKVNNDFGDVLQAYDLPSIDDKPVNFGVIFPNGRNNVVNPKCQNPEVLIKLIDYYAWLLNAAVPNGEKKIEEVLPFTVNNMHHITGPFKVEFHSYQDVKEVSAAVDAKTANPQFSSGYAYSYYDEIMKWVNGKEFVGLGRFLQMGSATSSLARSDGYVDQNRIIKDKLWGAPTKAQLDFGTTLEELLNAGFTQIITGEKPVDYFDQLIQEWKTAGGDQVTQAVNEEYGKK